MPPSRPAATTLAETRFRKVVAGPQKGLRHKWLRINSEGDALVLNAGKHHLTARLGVQARDLRLLDAAPASSPPAVLAREKSIIVNLEFIKCIITSDHCLIMDSGESRVAAFVEEMRRRMRGASSASSLSFLEPATEELGNSNVLLQQACSVETDFFPSIATIPNSSIDDPPQFLPLQDNSNYSGQMAQPHSLMGRLELSDIIEEMPFEIRVLETALEFVTSYVEHLTSGLEGAAHPALDAVISRVTERRLDRLRSIKSRMVRLNARVETIRELLEKLLDDDHDMRDLNLTAKLRLEERALMGSKLRIDREREDEHDKNQVEQLLETFFMNLDNTYNRLQTLAEYVDDTEDYIKFDIDTKRNQCYIFPPVPLPAQIGNMFLLYQMSRSPKSGIDNCLVPHRFIEYRLLIIIVTFG